MNECERIEMEISGMLDGAAGEGAGLPVLDHVAECNACREFYLQARALDALASVVAPTADEPAPLPSFQSVERSAGLAAPLPWRARPAVRWAVRIAAAVVVAAGLASVGVLRVPAALRVRDGMKVVVGEDRGGMSDSQFVDLAVTVLRADRKYRAKMLDLLNAVETGQPTRDEQYRKERDTVTTQDEGNTPPPRDNRAERFF